MKFYQVLFVSSLLLFFCEFTGCGNGNTATVSPAPAELPPDVVQALEDELDGMDEE